MRARRAFALCVAAAALARLSDWSPALAQAPIPVPAVQGGQIDGAADEAPESARFAAAIAADVRREETRHSEILRTLHVLTDVYGPRLTGSPSLKAAGEWALETLTSWGLDNGHLEPWEFGHAGWTNERLSLHIVSPVQTALVGEALAWTPGTRGTVTGTAVHLVPPDRPTAPDLTAYLDSLKDTVAGRIVLVGKNVAVPVNLDPPSKRLDDEKMLVLFDPTRPDAPPSSREATTGAASPAPMGVGEVSRRIDEFLVSHGALVRLNDAGRDHGQVVAYGNSTYDLSRVVPTVVIRNEDFGRISRILADGRSVELEVTVTNRVHPDGRTNYNVIAEIPGSDKRDEVVMLGGHLDSWHSATGATDNAIGCAAMMEAMRLLKVLGVQPRRTIRLALWSGEEQGLFGSRAYVRQHFGDVEQPTADFDRLSAYLNLDTGTGRIRGAVVFGPPDAATVIRRSLAPFGDLGVVGAIATRSRRLGLTDSGSFAAAGLPAVNFQQDPIEYGSDTHHTNLDTYERVVLGDMQSAAIEIAALAYELAMRDAPLPRFDRASMPPASSR